MAGADAAYAPQARRQGQRSHENAQVAQAEKDEPAKEGWTLGAVAATTQKKRPPGKEERKPPHAPKLWKDELKEVPPHAEVGPKRLQVPPAKRAIQGRTTS